MGIKISIITITYNSEKSIEKTIKSILKQKYRPLEYVFIDGCSKDQTVSIIKTYIPQLESEGIEVKFISEPDNGISDAFNKGISLSTGVIIGITNSDDTIEEGALVYIAEKFPEDVDVLYGNCRWEDKEKNVTYIRKSTVDLRDLNICMKILHPAAYVKKSAYEKYGGFRTEFRYCMDKELLARMQKMGAKFLYVDKILASVSAGGVSDKNLKGVIYEGKQIAIENGVPCLKVMFIFGRSYIMVKIKNTIKKVPAFYKIIQNVKSRG
ncbi:glycosyltransferase family 2 protein [Clostridium sp. 001]|uniref:glycosyltransferase family 2 protein n=1 Tax=Clostridium sp. 001 TaxID=1970093 RepID=UPI001C2C2E5B|nr:glycosyltransferase family 2 protein [Clostridium sp. 001]QXE19772.1 hypothetical protein B5S50_13580 [Clostridium sp. 001]